MSSEDITYYRERVSTERNRAAVAPSEAIADAHLKLAAMYENLLERLEQTAAIQDLEPLPRTDQQSRPDTLR